jgi:hypothetical protein
MYVPEELPDPAPALPHVSVSASKLPALAKRTVVAFAVGGLALAAVFGVAFMEGELIDHGGATTSTASVPTADTVPAFDAQTGWVACQVLVNNKVLAERGAEANVLDSALSDRIQSECGTLSDIWVFCINDALTRLSSTELLHFNVANAQEIARSCNQQAAR